MSGGSPQGVRAREACNTVMLGNKVTALYHDKSSGAGLRGEPGKNQVQGAMSAIEKNGLRISTCIDNLTL
jgi:hypothetical protein